MGLNILPAKPLWAVLTLLGLILGCDRQTPPSSTAKIGPDGKSGPASAGKSVPKEYVGRGVCAECHAKQTDGWRDSHHDLAMQEVNEQTVLGDFDDATFSYAGTTTTFTRRDGAFIVRTDGPDGELTDFPVAYVFGVVPLQQYLIAFPDGRYQALSIVWDTRPAAEGGGRWVHLYPGEAIDHRDPLHWTGVYQNWNQQCAECHSTNLVKGYDPVTNTYATTWSEIDVSCEACHGPGSAHAEWAAKVAGGDAAGDPTDGLTVDLEDPSGGVWEIDATTGIAERSAARGSATEIETCGRCHARRSPIDPDYRHGRPLLDSHRLALLDENLYHADGHIQDEVYVYGSFVQSRMYRAGVTCSDCHDPHGLGIAQPDAACARCHLRAKFAEPSHHFHPPDAAGGPSAGASCVACHMPSRVYMAVDSRRDHGFRIPRPDLSLDVGTPNACNDCHDDKSTEWAARAFAEWYGDVDARRPHFARALDAGRRGLPAARRLLAELAADPEMPAIARGTALAQARNRPLLADPDAIRAGLANAEPLVRLGALRGVEALDPRSWPELLAPLLDDDLRAVRIEAGRVLASLGAAALPEALRSSYELALSEYLDAQEVNADRPDGQLNLGLIYAAQGRPDEAERAYSHALRLDPWFSPAYVNLADLYRATGRDGDGEAILRRALERIPEDASVRHTLGLALVRQGRQAEATAELARAAELAPEQARYAYVHGVALHSGGESGRALEVLAAAHLKHPADPELLTALATISRDAGRSEDALRFARKLQAVRPDDPGVRQLVAELGG